MTRRAQAARPHARRRRLHWAAPVLAALAALGASESHAGESPTAATAATAAIAASASPPTTTAAMMRLAAGQLVQAQRDDGLVPYGFDFLADQPIEPDRVSAYNFVRQSYTAFVLAQYYALSRDPGVLSAVRRALDMLARHGLPIGKSTAQTWLERLHVLSLPFARWKLQDTLARAGWLYAPAGESRVPGPDGDYRNALTGNVALALLAELAYEQATGDARHASDRDAWRDGILALHIPGGGFRRAPVTIDDDAYVNGQGWLALTAYDARHPGNANVAAALSDLDDALPTRYGREPSPDFFHWGGIAAAHRYRATRDPRLLAFLRAQSHLFLERFSRRLQPEDNACADMETVAAVREVLAPLPPEHELVARLDGWLDRESAKLPSLQIRRGQTDVVLGGDARLHAPHLADYAGAFVAGLYDPVTRIDITAHCLSAMQLARGSIAASSR